MRRFGSAFLSNAGRPLLAWVLVMLSAAPALAGDIFGTWNGPNGSVYTFKNGGGNQTELTVAGNWTVGGRTRALNGKYYPLRYMAQLGYENGAVMMIQVARDGRTAQANWADRGQTGTFLLSRPGVKPTPPPATQTGIPISGTWYTPSSVYSLQHHPLTPGARISVSGSWVQQGKQGKITKGAYNPATRHVELFYQLWSGHTGKMDLYLAADGKSLQGKITQGGVQRTITLSRTRPAATAATGNAISIAGTWSGGPGVSYTFKHAALQGTQAVAVSGGWVQKGNQSVFTSGAYYPDRRFVEVAYRLWDGAQGVLRLTAAADGSTLSGTWSQQGRSGSIKLVRANSTPAPTYVTLAGRWQAQGALLVFQHGSVASGRPVNVTGTWTTNRVFQVKGTYNPANRTFSGRFADAMTTTGTLNLSVSADGRALSGSWTSRGSGSGNVTFSR